MRSEFRKIFQEIQADPDNATFTKQGIEPLYYASSSARINIIGQTPGRIAQKKIKFWGRPKRLSSAGLARSFQRYFL